MKNLNEKNYTIIYKDGAVVNVATFTEVNELIENDNFKINTVVCNLNNNLLVDNTRLETILLNCECVEDIESIEVDGNYISTDIGEYLVFTDYIDAENEAIEICKNIIEDCGISENLLFEAEIQGMIDESWFEDFWRESNEYYAYEEGIQYIATSEELEQLENGDITEDEIRENYLEGINASLECNWMEEYKFQFGEEEFQKVLIRENLIDIEELAKYCVDIDGVGHYIASYDGDETEHEGYYIYRTN